MRPRQATALLAVAAALLTPSAARADGDPASDVLLFQDAYLPNFPPPSEAETDTLTRLLAELRGDDFAMKVAVISSTGDLGANPELFGNPADYVNLLAHEIAFRVRNPHLLVVMPTGMAGRNLGPDAESILASIEIDTEAETDGLVRAAIEAVAKIASANGHATEVPDIEEDPEFGAGDGGRSYLALYFVAGLLVTLGLSLVAVSRRIRAREHQ